MGAPKAIIQAKVGFDVGLEINLSPLVNGITEESFYEFCRANADLRIELTSKGVLIVMPPTGGETGERNFNLTGSFHPWVKVNEAGLGFDSSTAFTLPNGAVRSPDFSWIKRERWEALPIEDRRKFAHICPDFVVELRSPSDALKDLQEKMEEYIANGARMGWLIDPQEKKVHVYSAQASVKCFDDPQQVSGDPVLPGFVLEMKEIWG